MWLNCKLPLQHHVIMRAGARSSPHQEKKLFPIFRPKAERKVLYIIRHGESEFNAATNTGKGFSDPQIYDPKLTAKGQSQVP